jgi:oligo-1,6-glucosidase
MLLPGNEHIYAFLRALPGSEILVLGNFTAEEHTVNIGEETWATAEQILGNYPDDPSLRLRPWELKVFRRRP